MSLVDRLGLSGELLSSPYTKYVIPFTIAALCWVNLKALPGFWHMRLFKGIMTQFLLSKADHSKGTTKSTADDSRSIFSYLVTTHYNSPVECDYNMHKSNSTFFSDLDINRAQLLVRLFGGFPRRPFEPAKDEKEKTLNVALGGVSCVFKREIKPFQRYEIWSRVITWDEKWLYIVSYFVAAGTGEKVLNSLHTEPGKISVDDMSKHILASSLSRYVCKDGRITVQPEEVLRHNGLISGAAGEHDPVFTREQQKGLEVARLFHGLDTLPAEFEPTASSVLGVYTDL